VYKEKEIVTQEDGEGKFIMVSTAKAITNELTCQSSKVLDTKLKLMVSARFYVVWINRERGVE
jgi:hypothetical protein